jgi:hypothetical protein
MTRSSRAPGALLALALAASGLAFGCVDKSPPPLWPSPPPPSVASPIGRPVGGQTAALAPTSEAPPDAARPASELPTTEPSEPSTVWSERPPPLAAPTPPPEATAPGEKPKLRAKLKESLEGTRDRIDESREERTARQRAKQQQKLEKQRRRPVKVKPVP